MNLVFGTKGGSMVMRNTTEHIICISINSLASGGAEKQSIMLAEALHKDFETYLVVLNPNDVYQARLDEAKKLNINIVFLKQNIILRFFQFTRFLKERKVNITFSFLPTDTIFTAICGKFAGVNYRIGGLRNSHLPAYKFTLLKWVHNVLLKYTISNNCAAYKKARNLGFQKGVMVIPNGIKIRTRKSMDKKDPSAGNSSENVPLKIISLGRLVKQKDYPTALRALFELKSRTGQAWLYRIVGHGPEESSIRDHIQSLGLSDRVEIIQHPKDINALLDDSDIYLCSSIFEGISNALLEAMNCGLPIVATKAGDNERLVKHNYNGLIAEISSSLQLADHLESLADSEKVRRQMGNNGYRRVQELYSFERYRTVYIDLVKYIDRVRIVNGEPVVRNQKL